MEIPSASEGEKEGPGGGSSEGSGASADASVEGASVLVEITHGRIVEGNTKLLQICNGVFITGPFRAQKDRRAQIFAGQDQDEDSAKDGCGRGGTASGEAPAGLKADDGDQDHGGKEQIEELGLVDQPGPENGEKRKHFSSYL